MTDPWRIRGRREAFEGMRTECQALVHGGARLADWSEVEGKRCYRKGGPLLGKASVRHALRGWLMRRSLPRLQEFENLVWLREHGFGAAEPVFAGAFFEAGRPRYQLLCVREVEGAGEIGRVLSEGDADERVCALMVLAKELGRMHALGFVHRDLFPRNVLWRAGDESVHFLDAWRGGPGFGLRGPAYDLGCWMLFGVELMAPDEIDSFLELYAESRMAAGGTLRADWRRAVRKERRGAVRRLEKQRARGSSLPGVRPEW